MGTSNERGLGQRGTEHLPKACLDNPTYRDAKGAQVEHPHVTTSKRIDSVDERQVRRMMITPVTDGARSVLRRR